jgi:hypothetical protein
MRRWISVLGAFILGISVALAFLGSAEYRAVFVPPGALRAPANVGFIAELGPSPSRPFLPLSHEAYDAVASSLPRTVTLIRAAVLTTDVQIAGRAMTRPVVIVDQGFFEVTGLPVLRGRALGAVDGNVSEPSRCVVDADTAGAAKQGAGADIGQEITTSIGPCTVVGVARTDALAYWLPSGAIVLPWKGHPPEIDRRLVGRETYGIINLLYRLPGGMPAGYLQERLKGVSAAGAAGRFSAIAVPSFLFAEQLRAAARSGGIAAAIGFVLGIVAALMLLLLDLISRIPDLRTRHSLGATPGLYFRLTWPREALRWLVFVGPAIMAAILILSVSSFRASRVHIPSAGLLVTVLASVVFSLLVVALRAVCLFVLDRRPDARPAAGAPWAARPAIAAVLTVQACTIVLLICALAYRTAYLSHVSVPLGMALDEVVVAEFRSPRSIAGATLADAVGRLVSAARRVPGVRSATIMLTNPVVDSGLTATLAIDGVGQFLNGRAKDVTPGRKVVGPAFARTVGAQVIHGRDMTWQDAAGSRRVALVNATMARTYWHGGNVLGQRLKFRPLRDAREEWAEVVGVISDIRHEGYRGRVKPEAYVSVLRENYPSSTLFVLIRYERRAAGRLGLDTAFATASGDFRLWRVGSLRDEAQAAVSTLQHVSGLLMLAAVFGCLSQWCAMVFAALSYAESRRREIGVRMALGASGLKSLSPVLKALLLAAVAALLAGESAGYVLRRWLTAVDHDLAGLGLGGFVVSALVATSSLLFATLLVVHAWRRRSPISMLRET